MKDDNVIQLDEIQEDLVRATSAMHENARTGELKYLLGCVMTNEGEVLFYNFGEFQSSSDMTMMLGCLERLKGSFSAHLDEVLISEQEFSETNWNE